MAHREDSIFAEARDAQGRRDLLRGQLRGAVELVGLVVIEQKAPLCQVLLPLRRLFQEFSSELECYIELEETSLFPNLLACIDGGHRWTIYRRSSDYSDTARMRSRVSCARCPN